jgi:hypothetical protein
MRNESSKKKPTPARTAESKSKSPLDNPYLTLAILIILVVVVFYPLTQYFFAQDDFQLMLRASTSEDTSMLNIFKPHPGQFRPLSKRLYFQVMYGIFDLNPLPYHVVSLLIHIFNILLFYILIRKFGMGHTPALITTSLFALSATFINIILWIACIQQLLGLFFILIALVLGLHAIEKGSRPAALLSAIAYILALFSMEQICLIPIILTLYVFLESREAPFSKRLSASVRQTAFLLGVMAVYLLFFMFWKRMPQDGPYTMHVGRNVISNLMTYLHWSFDFSVEIPFVSNSFKPGLTANHLFILVVIVVNIARGRHKLVLLGLGYYIAALLPVLFLREHTFFTHTYIPAFGLFLLLGAVIEDLHVLLLNWNRKFALTFITAILFLIPLMAYIQVRKNEHNILRSDYPLPPNFVMRRAIIAKNVYDDFEIKKIALPSSGKVFFLSRSKNLWYAANVKTAMGQGDEIKLISGHPDLEIFFYQWGDTLEEYSAGNSTLLFHDDLGHVFTEQEVIEKGGVMGDSGD